MSDADTTTAVVDAVRAEMGKRGIITTSVVVLAATIEPDGDTALWIAADPDASAWTTLGMLDYAASVERNAAGRGDE